MDAKMILGAALAVLGLLMLTNAMTLILFEVESGGITFHVSFTPTVHEGMISSVYVEV